MVVDIGKQRQFDLKTFDDDQFLYTCVNCVSHLTHFLFVNSVNTHTHTHTQKYVNLESYWNKSIVRNSISDYYIDLSFFLLVFSFRFVFIHKWPPQPLLVAVVSSFFRFSFLLFLVYVKLWIMNKTVYEMHWIFHLWFPVRSVLVLE